VVVVRDCSTFAAVGPRNECPAASPRLSRFDDFSRHAAARIVRSTAGITVTSSASGSPAIPSCSSAPSIHQKQRCSTAPRACTYVSVRPPLRVVVGRNRSSAAGEAGRRPPLRQTGVACARVRISTRAPRTLRPDGGGRCVDAAVRSARGRRRAPARYRRGS
jgi:hypothetical protein